MTFGLNLKSPAFAGLVASTLLAAPAEGVEKKTTPQKKVETTKISSEVKREGKKEVQKEVEGKKLFDLGKNELDWADKHNGVAFSLSGGGMRASVAALAALKFAQTLDQYQGAGYISGLSGGAWGITAHLLAGQRAGEAFKGFQTQCEKYASSTLGKLAKGKHWGHGNGFVTDSLLTRTMLSNWGSALAPIYIGPFLDSFKTDYLSKTLFAKKKYGEHTLLVQALQEFYAKNPKKPRWLVSTITNVAVKDKKMSYDWCDINTESINCPTYRNAPVPLADLQVKWLLSTATVTLKDVLAIAGSALQSAKITGAGEGPLAALLRFISPNMPTVKLGESDQKFLDAGVAQNNAIPPLLVDARKVKTILSFDFSNPGGERSISQEAKTQLDRLAGWCGDVRGRGLCGDKDFKITKYYCDEKNAEACDGTNSWLMLATNGVTTILHFPLWGKKTGSKLVESFRTSKTSYSCGELDTLYQEFLGHLEGRADAIKKVLAELK